MELRQKEGDDAFHPSIEYFLGNVILTTCTILFEPVKTNLCMKEISYTGQ